MLQTCSSVLLLTRDKDLISKYSDLALDCDIELRVEAMWNDKYRIINDKIITTSEYLEYINADYYPIVSLVLKEGESFLPYKDKIDLFVFNRNDTRELLLSFLKQTKELVQVIPTDVKSIIKYTNISTFTKKEYNFNFVKGEFIYKGKKLYITRSQQRYLAEWLLNGHKDNSRRMSLKMMRDKFGKDFLADVDRFGNIVED